MTKLNFTLHVDLCTFMTISRSVFLRIRNVSKNICRENQTTYFIFTQLFSLENLSLLWEKYCRAGKVTDDNMEHARCILDH